MRAAIRARRLGASLRKGRERGRKGKLKWAARAWASGGLLGSQSEEALDDARRFGMGDAETDRLREKLADVRGLRDFHGVWPQNVETVQAFVAIGSQWRVVAGAGALCFIGLDYVGAKAGLEARGVEVTADLFVGIQIMEGAALEALNRRKD